MVVTIDSKAAAKQESVQKTAPAPAAPSVKLRTTVQNAEEKKPLIVASSAPIAAPAAPAPPKLKLKVGGARVPEATTAAPPVATTSVPAAAASRRPSKQKKQKVTDMPPPPYVDDGSHDILQEVIAIEELEKTPQKPAKQRKVVEIDADEELLSLATNSPPPSSARPPETSELSTPATPAAPTPVPVPTSTPRKPPQSQAKSKKVAEKPSEPLPPLAPADKGKKKESVPTPPTSEASFNQPRPKKASSMVPAERTPMNEKKCRDVLKTIGKLAQAYIFARPVDPIADGCPT